jgi:hypothetical protein
MNDVTTEPPTWEIKNRSYLPCDLPFGYKAYRMNITFVAYENITIRCGYLVYDDEMFFPAYSEISTVTVHPKGLAAPPDTECSCNHEVIAVVLSNLDIFITNKAESCPIDISMKDTCFPNIQCNFNHEGTQLLTFSVKDRCNQKSSFLSSTFTLVTSDKKCSSKTEISNQCETGTNALQPKLVCFTVFSNFFHRNC